MDVFNETKWCRFEISTDISVLDQSSQDPRVKPLIDTSFDPNLRNDKLLRSKSWSLNVISKLSKSKSLSKTLFDSV